MKAVIYARYSAGPNQTEQSIEGQVRDCRAFAENKGMTIEEIYADSHISGKTDARPEFQRLIADAKKKKFEAVIVWKTDRFSRNKYDAVIYKRELKKAGVRLYYAAEPMAEGPEGVLMESVLEGMAEYYSLELGQKVSRGMNENARKAKSNGGTRTFGYRTGPDKKFVPDPDEAWYVREIFRRAAAGDPTSEIRDWLNASGIRTTRGNNFTVEAVNKLIRTRKYLGEYKYSDIMIKDAIEPIIDPELWEAAQRKGVKHNKPSPEYLLSGRIFCGLCGAPVHGVSGTGKNGNTWYYYVCSEKRKKQCSLKAFPARDLEQKILKASREVLLNPETLAGLSHKIWVLLNNNEKVDQEREALEKQYKNLKDEGQRMVLAIGQGAPVEMFKDRMIEITKIQDQISLRLEELRPRGPRLTEEEIDFAIRFFIGKDDKKVLTKFVARVELFETHALVYFNIGEGPDGDELKKIDLELPETESSTDKHSAPPKCFLSNTRASGGHLVLQVAL